MIALVGNLARDLLPDQPPKVGGGPFHGARALHRLRVPARIVTRCADRDRADLLPPLVRLGTPVRVVSGTATVRDQWRFSVLGVTDFLKKPTAPEELIATVSRLVA